ncbi:unnamed protein product [Lymnaea stagnalis]|uniref:AIG1-type G domain-containing protein n=1 Tax=Lymnaea stagnalis TaxID=6523 RepID=A0AAV2IMZ6_LYMST
MADDIVLLFVGRTGNGKSSTANSVIGEKFFSTGKLYDEKRVEQTKTKKVDGFKMTVVDGTDIGDTGSDMNGDLQDTIRKAETAVQLCESGFNALIFVLTYGTRFTKQEKDAVDLIKSLFGKDIFRRFGIIVMTRGDQFEMDTEDEPKTFDQWCQEQTGDIRSLFQECDYRLVLFDNKTKDNQVLSRQREVLLRFVQRDKRYSSKDFNDAESGRKDIRLLHEFSETERESKALMEKIDSVIGHKKSKEPLNHLTDLYDQTTRYENDVLKKFQGCSYAQGLLNNFSLKKMALNMKIKEMKAVDITSSGESAPRSKSSAPRNKSSTTKSNTCTIL